MLFVVWESAGPGRAAWPPARTTWKCWRETLLESRGNAPDRSSIDNFQEWSTVGEKGEPGRGVYCGREMVYLGVLGDGRGGGGCTVGGGCCT